MANYGIQPRFEKGVGGGVNTRWQKGGPSPNPGGKTKLQRQFEQALTEALVGEDPPARAKELAEIVWNGARRNEAWAVQMLFQRLAPQAIDVRMSRGRGEGDEIDYSKLSDDDIRVLEAILQRQAIAGGEGGAQP